MVGLDYNYIDETGAKTFPIESGKARSMQVVEV